ncbi:MAG: hypothetical protein QOD78_441 [Chloroflexota bacterium]|nr:hypothetical protein [Chloroflexota bacterium]
MRALRQHPVVVAVTTALVVLAAVAGPVRGAGPAPWLTASPTASPISLAAGESVTVTITNTDRRTASSALTVTLAKSPSSAPFAIVSDLCAGVILRPGGSCTVEVRYDGPAPTTDHTAALTVASGKPLKASVTRVLEVGVAFADVCVARGGLAEYGGTITVLGAVFTVGDRCDWDSNLATAVYNAAFGALDDECFDLGYTGVVGYPVTGETGTTAIGCVVD